MATCAKSFVSVKADVISATKQSAVGGLGVASVGSLPLFGDDWSVTSVALHTVVSSEVQSWVPGICSQASAGAPLGRHLRNRPRKRR
jgi:hypothetical protein